MPGKRTPEQQREHMRAYRAGKKADVPIAPETRIIKTAADVERQVAKARTLKPVTGEAHYFDGWVAEMGSAQRDYVYAKLAARATPRR